MMQVTNLQTCNLLSLAQLHMSKCSSDMVSIGSSNRSRNRDVNMKPDETDHVYPIVRNSVNLRIQLPYRGIRLYIMVEETQRASVIV
jgi:hypothetical protein